MTVKIVNISTKNFTDIPRPANNRFNCQECFYWVGKKDGRSDLVKQKKNWFLKQDKKHGPLGKLLLWGRREKPIGFAQFGPVSEFQTAQLIYQDEFSIPRSGWCVTCLAVQTNYRNRGMATRLLRNILRDLKRRGVKTIDAYPFETVASWNQVSTGPVGLYQKCGFKKIAEIKDSRVLMRKKL